MVPIYTVSNSQWRSVPRILDQVLTQEPTPFKPKILKCYGAAEYHTPALHAALNKLACRSWEHQTHMNLSTKMAVCKFLSTALAACYGPCWYIFNCHLNSRAGPLAVKRNQWNKNSLSCLRNAGSHFAVTYCTSPLATTYPVVLIDFLFSLCPSFFEDRKARRGHCQSSCPRALRLYGL